MSKRNRTSTLEPNAKKVKWDPPAFGIYYRYDKKDIKDFVSDKDNLLAYVSFVLDLVKSNSVDEEALQGFRITMFKMFEQFETPKYPNDGIFKLRDWDKGVYLQEDNADPFERYLESVKLFSIHHRKSQKKHRKSQRKPRIKSQIQRANNKLAHFT